MRRQTEDLTAGAPMARPSARVVLAGTLGNTLEFYDFIVYGTVAALVFNKVFFPQASPIAGTLLALSTFAVGFLVRPLGAAFFGHLGDRVGRRNTLVLTLLIMGVATVLIGLLPTYSTAGIWSPLLLVVLRLVQGAAVGGEWGGALLFIGEHASSRERGRATSFAQLGSPLGTLLANGVVVTVVAATTDEQFLAWGWRIPFLLSLVLVIFGLYMRLRATETPVFHEMKRDQDVSSSPIRDVFQRHWRRLLLALGITVVQHGSYYIFTTVGLAYLSLNKVPADYGLYGTVVGAAVAIPVILIAGRLSDRVGRRPIFALSTVVIGLWGFAYFLLLNAGSMGAIVTAIAIGMGTWAIGYGVYGALVPELFPRQVRYTGTSLSYQFVGALAGLIPVASLSLVGSTGTALSISVLLLGFAVVSTVAIALATETVETNGRGGPKLGGPRA